MTNKKAAKDNGKGLAEEIAGIILLAIAVYAGVALYPAQAGANLGGVVGENLSFAILAVIGYTGYLFPFLILIASARLLLRRVFRMSLAVPVSFAALMVCLAALFGGVEPLQGAGSDEAGGFIGRTFFNLLSAYLARTGAFIFLAAAIIITVFIATGISLVQAGIKLFPPAASVFKMIIARMRGSEVDGGEIGTPPETEATESPEEVKVEKKAETKPPEGVQPLEGAEPPAIITYQGQKKNKKAADDEDEPLEISSPHSTFATFQLPPLSLLVPAKETKESVDSGALLENSKILEKKLLDFGIEGRVLEVRPGPVVTMYEFEPAPGVKVNRITALSDDLALALKAMSIRIVAPIPGKAVVGIEIPNHSKEPISFREMLESPGFARSKSRLTLALGKDASGSSYVADLAKMPHLLIAGATGTGKSVSVNAMILSILFKATPEEVRFLMVDPKMLELSAYEGIPHLITPVITDTRRAATALKGMVAEMGKRYKLMSMKGAKNIEAYNRMIEEAGEKGEGDEKHSRLPYIVVIIDELADLMMTSGKDVEECLVRLSQMARASGIHLLVATQRPSVDVVTGLIKTNLPARIAFQLPSKTDSRTILDSGGAETLLGEGDMLFLPPGTSKLQRLHGAYVSEPEILRVTEFWKKQGSPVYDHVITEPAGEGAGDEEDLGAEFVKRYDEAVEMASQLEMISTSYIQRRFRIGYNTAARIIEKMEKDGIVGPAQGSRPREVLKRG
ncbi:MAG: DNA translocase FtsK 4TM domain-containing protein [Deltaproteobacteria bacterium]|nr:DNA translocase FtsK 4TM domain-containing protein [Deltaproteobacteria bacterium]